MMALRSDPVPDEALPSQRRSLPTLLPTPTERALPGFEHVKRFHHPSQDRVWVKVLPGEYYTSTSDELITTVLGSCVAACVWDPVARVGGMNHFMIPGSVERHAQHGSAIAPRYGIFAMELLINSVLKHGGQRPRLLAKISGGGNVVRGVTSIGDLNIEFARTYLAREQIRLVGEHVGGSAARKVIFNPVSGDARVLELTMSDDSKLAHQEQAYARRLRSAAPTGDIELFGQD